jgi:hypothetical protein
MTFIFVTMWLTCVQIAVTEFSTCLESDFVKYITRTTNLLHLSARFISRPRPFALCRHQGTKHCAFLRFVCSSLHLSRSGMFHCCAISINSRGTTDCMHSTRQMQCYTLNRSDLAIFCNVNIYEDCESTEMLIWKKERSWERDFPLGTIKVAEIHKLSKFIRRFKLKGLKTNIIEIKLLYLASLWNPAQWRPGSVSSLVRSVDRMECLTRNCKHYHQIPLSQNPALLQWLASDRLNCILNVNQWLITIYTESWSNPLF